jgi:hypothetical protein
MREAIIAAPIPHHAQVANLGAVSSTNHGDAIPSEYSRPGPFSEALLCTLNAIPPVVTVQDTTRETEVTIAYDKVAQSGAENGLGIDDNAIARRGEDGAWVSSWTWVSSAAIDEKK